MPGPTRGRVLVSPGQTIQSAEWGNPTADQTVNCFANAADRDTQWPAPQDGAVCYLADQRRHFCRINGVWQPLAAAPALANALNPGQVDIATGNNAVIVSEAITLAAPRLLRLTGRITGTQITAGPGLSHSSIRIGNVIFGYVSYDSSIPLNAVVAGTGVIFYQAAAGPLTVTLNVTTAGTGGLRVAAGSCALTIEEAA